MNEYVVGHDQGQGTLKSTRFYVNDSESRLRRGDGAVVARHPERHAPRTLGHDRIPPTSTRRSGMEDGKRK